MFKIIISKDQTDIIKGIGILLIVLHNYFHWVPPSTGENEFIFNVQNVNNVFLIISESYLNIINVFFSFFGHYGVQLFIFISGYGLSKSFIAKPQNFLLFIKKRALKIYPAFLISIFILIVYDVIVFYRFPTTGWGINILSKLLMIHTLLPGRALTINGSWWFYGLIMQLYFLFIPLFYAINKWKEKGLFCIVLLCYCLTYFLYAPLRGKDVYIMANAPAHIPEFALGISLALNPHLTIRKIFIPLLILGVIIGNYSFFAFPITFIIVTYLLVIIVLYIFREQYKFIYIIKFYGKISMYLFAVHGFFRTPFVSWAKNSSHPIKTIGIGILYLVTVTIIAYISREIYVLMKRGLMIYIKNKKFGDC